MSSSRAGLLLLCVWFVVVACVSRNEAFVGYSEVSLATASTGASNQNFRENVSLFERPDCLLFSTEFGEIEVELATTAAPETVSFIKDLVAKGTYNGCSFYRAEPPGDTYDQGSTVPRKGYALVQGGLFSCGKQQDVDLPVESRWKHTKGTVSLITVGFLFTSVSLLTSFDFQRTSEFFFSLEDHPEWDGSFSVWGKVASASGFSALERIAALPTHQEVHPSGTVMRILSKEVTFSLALKPSRDN
ncbi:uncharacterized protein LOC112342082 isoform X1 [Selaginella moellendorffii]|uniref:uncharacterized protein LOC112342082 isoform X1 n=1 Tax=Selaginella moellendorffii TaxID=88036 RepID=UPI000D1C2F50|nr:uncharacterized protein LOC112342082 isoform X1 [Selaginella moellendorffii]|eukprot:XP_024519085.1 uncharacterized protein LOC112342082 isoform X1 [Selaginella moellendorffii]